MYETPIKMDTVLGVYDLPVTQADDASLSLGLVVHFIVEELPFL